MKKALALMAPLMIAAVIATAESVVQPGPARPAPLLLAEAPARPTPTPEAAIKNGNFSQKDARGLPLHWILGGAEKSFVFADGAVTLKGSDGAGLVLTQQLPTLQSGVAYEVTYQLKSSIIDKDYRVYYEATQLVDGKERQNDFSAYFHKTPTHWEAAVFTFTVPPTVRASRLVFQIQAGGDVEFRNITLMTVAEKAAKLRRGEKRLGGVWQFSQGSALVTDADGIERVLVKQNYPGAGAILKGVPLQIGKTYTLRYAARAEGKPVMPTRFTSPLPYNPFQVRVKFDGVAEKAVSSWVDTLDSRWQDKQFTFRVPPTAASGTIDLECATGEAGLFKFADNALIETTALPAAEYRIILDSPCYRNMIFASLPVTEISGVVITGPAVKTVQLTLKLGDQTVAAKTEANTGSQLRFAFPAAALPAGDFVLTAALATPTGIVAAPAVQIKKLPPQAMEVVQDRNRNFFINGKLFFPVMFWDDAGFSRGRPRKVALYNAARHGVNVVLNDGSSAANALRILDRYQEAGMKVLLNFGGPANHGEGDVLKAWTRQLADKLPPAVRNHPALFGYFLIDEPCWPEIPVANILASYQALKAFDPYHPVFVNMMPKGELEELAAYSQGSDIYGNDIYPVPYPASHSFIADKRLSAIGKYSQLMYEAGGGRKAIWTTLQGFSWQQLGDPKLADKELGYPTYLESRFMAYDALLNNANAVAYWGGICVYSRRFSDQLLTITQELQEMSGLLLLGRKVNGASSTEPALRCQAITFGDKKYLIALNNSPVALQAEIASPFTTSSVRVFQEKRTVAVQHGKLTDRFQPFEVHVYGDADLPPGVNPPRPAEPELDKKIALLNAAPATPWLGWEKVLTRQPPAGTRDLTAEAVGYTQSSRSQWEKERDRQFLLKDGDRSGAGDDLFAFHTQWGQAPYIIIELKQPSVLREIYIENSYGMYEWRAATLTIWVSDDQQNWKKIWGADYDEPSWTVALGGVKAKYVKLGLTEENYLHLHRVRIYGN